MARLGHPWRLALALSLFARSVWGAEPYHTEALPPAAPAPKQKAPDYDGRGSPAEPTSRKLFWVPRVLLFPAYVVHVVRRPLEAGITFAERSGWPVRDWSAQPILVGKLTAADVGQ